MAGRENAVSSQRVNQLSDLVKKIALKDKIDESRELAADVDTSLYAGLKKGNEGLAGSRGEEGSVCGADRGEYAVDSCRDQFCDKPGRCRGIEPA